MSASPESAESALTWAASGRRGPRGLTRLQTIRRQSSASPAGPIQDRTPGDGLPSRAVRDVICSTIPKNARCVPDVTLPVLPLMVVAQVSPFRRQNPREEPGALAAHAGIRGGTLRAARRNLCHRQHQESESGRSPKPFPKNRATDDLSIPHAVGFQQRLFAASFH